MRSRLIPMPLTLFPHGVSVAFWHRRVWSLDDGEAFAWASCSCAPVSASDEIPRGKSCVEACVDAVLDFCFWG